MLTTAGPVRPKNEDTVAYWQPETPEARLGVGCLALLADGVGGHGNGDVASRLAVDTALAFIQKTTANDSPRKALTQMFDAANVAVYDAGMKEGRGIRMGTTLTAALFRHAQVTIGHVGDCRAYRIHQGRMERLTSDHSYAAMQMKMGLISEEEAMESRFRSSLTRNLGQNPFVRPDLSTSDLVNGDLFLMCSDGLHGVVTEAEILEVLLRQPPEEVCQALVALAERRGTDDNVSVQLLRVDKVQRVAYYRGLPHYLQDTAPPVSQGREIEVGQVLDGRFEITGTINRGGMAAIYRATDLPNGKTVAIKIPFMQFESDPAAFSRFEREEEIGRSLSHPYLLQFIPVEKKGRPYIVMEYLEGRTLEQLLQEIHPLPVPDALRIASRVAEALQYMHEHQVIHRDLKPQNIMLCNDGSVRIMDFGIARSAEARKITFAGLSGTMGTPDYMAPEQVRGKRGDERTDLYSLGAILYEMLTGKVPYEGANAFIVMNARLTGDPEAPRTFNPEIPEEVEEIILHAMERNPADRYASAAEIRKELDDPKTVALTKRHERLRRPKAWKIRWRRFRTAILAVLALLIVFGLLFFISKHNSSGQAHPVRPHSGRG
jgi:serine/threonine-protein kinase